MTDYSQVLSAIAVLFAVVFAVLTASTESIAVGEVGIIMALVAIAIKIGHK